jgi:phage-related protein
MWKVSILNQTVQKELDALEPTLKARFLHICELLETFGPSNVGMPHLRFLTGKLWEMRMNSIDGHARAIYLAAAQRTIVVVHVFGKKTSKTPRRAIDLAIKRSRRIDS